MPPRLLHTPTAFLAVLGAATIVAYITTSRSPAAAGGLYLTASVGGLVAVVVGLHRQVPRPVLPWRVFSLAVALFSAGDIVWCLTDVAGLQAPSPYLSDAVYLASYPLFACALVGFSASRREPIESLLRDLVDASLLFVAGFSVLWFVVLDRVVDEHRIGGFGLGLTVAYPTLDLILLALTLRFTFSSGPWPFSYRLLATAFFTMFLGDLMWRIGIANGSYSVGSWTNSLFMGSYVLWGMAALHPSITKIGRLGIVPSTSAKRTPWRRLAVLGIAVLVPPVVLVVEQHRINDPIDVSIFACTIAVLPLLSLVRVGDMLRTLHRVAAERDRIVEASPVPICVLDHDGIVHVWNTAAERVSGYPAAEVVGEPVPLVAAGNAEQVALLYSESLRGVEHDRVDVRVLTRSGKPIDVRFSTAPLGTDDGRIVVLFEDVTHEREQEAEIAFLATHDPLTNLPNRRQFEDELGAATAAGGPTHVALFDIDDFKSLNDTGGHALGDHVLRALAALLKRSMRRDGSLARLSGDEFALILDNVGEDAAERIVERLLDSARDFRLEAHGTTFDVTLSAGLYSLTTGDSPELALQRADEALYRAKANGKNRAQVWAPSPVASLGAARAWSPRIKDALRDDRIDLYLQPIVTLAEEEPVFYEALCRLRDEDGAVVPAAEWIEHAEQIGLMPAIDRRMIEKAEEIVCADLRLRVFINISASSVHDSSVLQRLDEALHRVPLGALGIEITEHAALSDPSLAVETLAGFRELGALVAIDDFGTGFTSFTELATLPCDIVKIPGTFTSAQSSADTAAIAGAITNIAHHYGKKVVIEGVECPAMARRARLLGIEYAQGWHYGRPRPCAHLVLSAVSA